MIEAAKARAEEVGATNVEIRPMEAEWIDLPTASVDAVLCRWGYMLLADPEAALRETRRVLRPGGRVALAAWAGPDANPWFAAIGARDGRARPDRAAARRRAGPARVRPPRRGSRSCSTRPGSTTSRSGRWTSPSTPRPRRVVGALDRDVGVVLARRGRPQPGRALRAPRRGRRRATPRTCGTTARSRSRRARWWRPRAREGDGTGPRHHDATRVPAHIRLLLGPGDRRRRPGAHVLPAAVARPAGARARRDPGAAAEERAVGDRGRRPAQPLPAQRRPRRHHAARPRDARATRRSCSRRPSRRCCGRPRARSA